jgi:hypothetical protein
MTELRKKIDEAFKASELEPGKRRFALMLFETEVNLGISNQPNKWVNFANRFYSKGLDALEAYSNTPCPASQLVDGETPEELEQAMLEMVEHFKDEKWLEETLYPSL